MSDISSLLTPPPVLLEVNSLEEVLALGELEMVEGEADIDCFSGDRKVAEVLRARANWRRWHAQAQVLARAGVLAGPSHRIYRGQVFSSGSFADVVDAGQEPVLVLGHRIDERLSLDQALPYVPTNWPWRAVTVQAGGMLCEQPRFVGLVLEPSDQGRELIAQLDGFCDQDGGHNCVGMGGLALSELADYAELVGRLGLRAETSWSNLTEAVYPLDLESVSRLTDAHVPSNGELYPFEHSSLASFLGDNEIEREWGSWCLYVLGRNCD